MLGKMDTALTIGERMLLAIGCLATLAMMLVVSVDAIGRYLFNEPLGFTYDLVARYLLVAAMMLTLSETLRHGGHINVGVFAAAVPRRARQLLLGVSLILASALAAGVAYETTFVSYDSWKKGIVAFGPYPWPKDLEDGIVAMSWIALALRLLHMTASVWVSLIGGDPSVEIPISDDHSNPLEEGV